MRSIADHEGAGCAPRFDAIGRGIEQEGLLHGGGVSAGAEILHPIQIPKVVQSRQVSEIKSLLDERIGQTRIELAPRFPRACSFFFHQIVFFSRSRFQISWGGSLYFIFVFYFQICILFLKDQINPVLSPFSSFLVVFLAFLTVSHVFHCSSACFPPLLFFFRPLSPLPFVFFLVFSLVFSLSPLLWFHWRSRFWDFYQYLILRISTGAGASAGFVSTGSALFSGGASALFSGAASMLSSGSVSTLASGSGSSIDL